MAIWPLVSVAVLAIVAFGAGTSPAQYQPHAAVAGTERDFHVEWEQRQTRLGPVIAGYVHNDGGTPASKVSVLIEGLDGAGQPVNATVGYVVGTVPALSRTYFEVRVPSAASYRVSVSSFEWLKGGGGGGGM